MDGRFWSMKSPENRESSRLGHGNSLSVISTPTPRAGTSHLKSSSLPTLRIPLATCRTSPWKTLAPLRHLLLTSARTETTAPAETLGARQRMPGLKTFAPLRTARPHISPTTTVWSWSSRGARDSWPRTTTASSTSWWADTVNRSVSRCWPSSSITSSLDALSVLTLVIFSLH